MYRKAEINFLNFFPFAFVALVVIGGGIFLGVSSFYGSSYDIRANEARILASKLEQCFLLENVDFFSPDFDVYSACGLVKDSLGAHLVLIADSSDKEWFAGVYDFKTQCGLSEKNEAYPKCVSGTFSKGGKTFSYLVGSNQRSTRL